MFVVNKEWATIMHESSSDNKLNLIKETLRTKRTQIIIGILNRRRPHKVQNLTQRIMKTG